MPQTGRLNKVIELLEQGFRLITTIPTLTDRAFAAGRKPVVR